MERLRAVRRAMSFEEFERTIPVRPGWKREYYDGQLHLRPSWSMVYFEIDPRTARGDETDGLRPVRPEDRGPLESAFTLAFAAAPEYCEYDDAGYAKQVGKYFDGFFGKDRGTWSPCSRVVLDGGEVVASALFKHGKRWPILDCVFAVPGRQRAGLASAATRAGLVELALVGHDRLRSCAMLANPDSIAWHVAVGFRELPSLMLAQSRAFCASYELKRRKDYGLLTPETERQLTATCDHWFAEYERLDALTTDDKDALIPSLEGRW